MSDAKKKIILKPTHDGWIDVEVITKAVNSGLNVEDFADQRRLEGFSILHSLHSYFDVTCFMRWDDAYDWIYRYGSPEKAREVLERTLNIRSESEAPLDDPDIELIKERNLAHQSQEDKLFDLESALSECEIIIGGDDEEDFFEQSLPDFDFDDRPLMYPHDPNWGGVAPQGWVKVTASVRAILEERNLDHVADQAPYIGKENKLEMAKFGGKWWASQEVVKDIANRLIAGQRRP